MVAPARLRPLAKASGNGAVAKRRAQEARQRQRRSGNVPPVEGRTRLESLAVAAPTRAAYEQALLAFVVECAENRREIHGRSAFIADAFTELTELFAAFLGRHFCGVCNGIGDAGQQISQEILRICPAVPWV